MIYETMVVIDGHLKEDEVATVSKYLTNKLKDLSTHIKIKRIGLKTLAYEIHECKQAYYIRFYYTLSDNTNMRQWQNLLRTDKNIIKYLTTSTDPTNMSDIDDYDEEVKTEQQAQPSSSTEKKIIDVFDLIFDIK